MFVKRTSKNTLAENFEEAKNVEKEMLSLVGNPGNEETKTTPKKFIFSTQTTL
jgi:hypothetical protein